MEKVSIIVPIYNVEKYLSKCIESIINQTYTNLEIILINDGSPDDSLKICKKYQKMDKRISIIDKKNGGVSSARNAGIDASSGEYLIFVDSDDWLELDAVEYMVSLVKENNCDFGISKNCYKFEDECQVEEDNITILNASETTALLLSTRVEIGCWNKIYKKSLLVKNKLKFDENQFFGEGLFFITNVSQKTKKTAVGEKKVYHYRQDNIVSATKKYKYKNYVNGEKSLDLIYEHLIKRDQIVLNQLYIHYCLFYCNAIYSTIINNQQKNYKKDIKYWRKRGIYFYKKICNCKELTKKRKWSMYFNLYFSKLFVLRRNIQLAFKAK